MPYYPQDFETDANGKRQSWEAVVQIPFIDADVLLDTVDQIIEADEKADDENKLLSNAERRRNVRGKSHVFVAPHRLVESISNEENVPQQEEKPVLVEAAGTTTTATKAFAKKSNTPRKKVAAASEAPSSGRGRPSKKRASPRKQQSSDRD